MKNFYFAVLGIMSLLVVLTFLNYPIHTIELSIIEERKFEKLLSKYLDEGIPGTSAALLVLIITDLNRTPESFLIGAQFFIKIIYLTTVFLFLFFLYITVKYTIIEDDRLNNFLSKIEKSKKYITPPND